MVGRRRQGKLVRRGIPASCALMVAFILGGRTPAHAAPIARADATELDFGAIEFGETRTRRVTVTNAGDTPLKLVAISRAMDAPVTYDVDKGDGVTLPILVDIHLTPTQSTEAPIQRPFMIRTDDPANPDITIMLRWEVLPPRLVLALFLGEKSPDTRPFYERIGAMKPGRGVSLVFFDLEDPDNYAGFQELEREMGRRIDAPMGLAVLPGPGAPAGIEQSLITESATLMATVEGLIAAAGETGRVNAEDAFPRLGSEGSTRARTGEVAKASIVRKPPAALPLWVWAAAGVGIGSLLVLVLGGKRRVESACLLAVVLAPAFALAQPARLDGSPPLRDDGDYVVSVFATGGTRAALEVCGCSSGQFGGVARRSFFLFRVRNEVDRAVVVDAGGWIPEERRAGGAADAMDMDGNGADRLALLQARTNLQALANMGYDAVNVTAGDLRFGLDAFAGLAGQVPFLSTDLETTAGRTRPWEPVRIRRHGARATAILGLSGLASADAPEGVRVENPSEAIERALKGIEDNDRVVLLSGLRREDNERLAARHPRIDLIVESGEHDGAGTVAGRTVVASTVEQGKAVIRVDLGATDGSARPRRIPIGEDVQDDPAIQGLLSSFYEEVKNLATQGGGMARTRPALFEDEVESMKQGYAGSGECKSCHQAEYAQWEGTRHAHAYRSLQRVDRYYVPKCIQCHTVGFGSATGTGFSLVPRPTRHLEGVGCESCHGQGSLHVRRPAKTNIVRKVPLEHCAKCHDQENHPQFEERKQAMLPEVDHSAWARGAQEERALEDLVRERLGGGKTVVVDLFVMAQCPYGTETENVFLQLKRRFKDKLEVQLHFIARAKGLEVTVDPKRALQGASGGAGCSSLGLEVSDDPDARFTSLHGPAEVAEGIRQVVIQRRFPDKLWDYLTHRNKSYQLPEWRPSAQRAGIDAEELQRWVADEGDELFRANIREALERNILSSPTILVDGREYRGSISEGRLIRFFCGRDERQTACADLPACFHDTDCEQPGKVGVCADGGTPRAACVYSEPVPVRMTVINAAACPTCTTRKTVEDTRIAFPGLSLHDLEFDDPEAQPFIREFGIRDLPAFILSHEVERAARYSKVAPYLRPGNTGFLLTEVSDKLDYRIGAPWALVEPREWFVPRGSRPGEPHELEITVSNAGSGRLLLDRAGGVRTFSPRLSFELADDPADSEVRRIKVRFTAPDRPGPYAYLVVLHTNDPLHPFQIVPLRGFVPENEVR